LISFSAAREGFAEDDAQMFRHRLQLSEIALTPFQPFLRGFSSHPGGVYLKVHLMHEP
jgi:hypothetical protein